MKLDDPQITTCPGMADNWILTADFYYKGHNVTLTLPTGFVTDLASIPRFLWNLIAPFELSLTAPIIHDWFYRNSGNTQANSLTRGQVDQLFLDIMKDEGVSYVRRKAAYLGVRLFGGSSWGTSKVVIIPVEKGDFK